MDACSFFHAIESLFDLSSELFNKTDVNRKRDDLHIAATIDDSDLSLGERKNLLGPFLKV